MKSFKQNSSRSITMITIVCIAVLAIGLMAALSGCGKASVVGKWNDPTDNTVVEFTADGKVLSDSFPAGVDATYTDKDGTLTISAAGAVVLTMSYTLDGDKMNATDLDTDEKATFTRVK